MPRPLAWLGLAEQPVVVTGHPRFRARIIEGVRRRRRRQDVLAASLGIVLLLVLGGWGIVRSPLLAVEAVSVVGVDALHVTEVTGVAAVAPGQNVLDVDLEAVTRLVEALPWVEQATVRRRLPSTVEIRVSERRPVLQGVAGAQHFLLDREGVVIEQASDAADLPTVELPVAPVVGSTIALPSIQAAVQVAAAMPAGMRPWVRGYEVDSGGEVTAWLRIPTEDGPADLSARLGRPVDVAVKAATIASLIDETIGRGMRPQGLDVRIPDRPVVVA